MADHENHSGGKTQLRERFAINQTNWKWYSKVFPKIMGLASGFIQTPIIGPIVKKIAFMDQSPKSFTQGYSFDLNHRLNENDQYQNTVLPVDIIRKAIRESGYRSVMHQCLCRTGNNCGSFANNLGCIFIGDGARATVKNGVAREATVAEALEHLDKAVDSGLVGMSMWIEIENYVWGIKREDHFKWLEICFCCPCCCIALQNLKKMSPDVKQRFRAMGWKAKYLSGCDGCGICTDKCPMGSIVIKNKAVEISDNCFGCGICVSECPQKAIEMEMVAAAKERMQDYFEIMRPDV